MIHLIILAGLALLLPVSVEAGIFGEGYSSAEKGAPADIRFRTFTIVTQQEECERSARPAEIMVFPDPLVLQIGEQIHRSNVHQTPGELVIEAYAGDGTFLPSVPIIVSTSDLQNVTTSRSDWDYLEAVSVGEDELVVAWACETDDGLPVETRVRISVITGDSTGD